MHLNYGEVNAKNCVKKPVRPNTSTLNHFTKMEFTDVHNCSSFMHTCIYVTMNFTEPIIQT